MASTPALDVDEGMSGGKVSWAARLCAVGAVGARRTLMGSALVVPAEGNGTTTLERSVLTGGRAVVDRREGLGGSMTKEGTAACAADVVERGQEQRRDQRCLG